MFTRAFHSAIAKRSGFTLVELLVVIAVLGILIALLLPAIQASREAARNAQCKNNLKQLAVAFWNHEQAHKRFPTGGWGYKWIGEPDGGYGKDQPGGWAYNILAYMEHESLRKVGSGIANRFTDPLNPARQEAFLQLVSTPLPIFNCSSKRPNEAWPIANDPLNPYLAMNSFSCSYANGCRVARSDYRVNGGNKYPGDQTGPGLAQDPKSYSWIYDMPGVQNGISYQRSMVRVHQIVDGTSKTAMIGEKFLNSNRYTDGSDPADDQSVFTGHDRDNCGYTGNGPESIPPMQDQPKIGFGFAFGGPHSGGFNMVFCDGSVQHLAYDISDQVWIRYGGRDDESL